MMAIACGPEPYIGGRMIVGEPKVADQRVHNIVMDFNTRKTYIESDEVELTKLEFELLSLFIKNKNRALEREYLLQNIWNDNEATQKRTVNVTINRLKKKIDPQDEKEYIVPVRGIGYKFQ